MSRDNRYHKEDSGVSPIVATIILILATMFIGGMAFVAFRSQSASLSKNADIETQSADLITTSGGSLFSVAVKNTGTVPMDRIEVSLPNLTKSYSSSDFSGGTHENTVSGSLMLKSDYPVLRVFDNPSSDGGDTGTRISNVQELQDIQKNLSGDYYLTQNIDATDTKNWNGGKGFNPIGTRRHPFTGTFDGNGYIIENLYINKGSADDVGLFGNIHSSAIIENVKLRNVNIHGSNDVGGLVGDSNHSQVINCYSTGKVHGSRYVGGLVGYSHHGTQMTNCYSTGELRCTNFGGGLVGLSFDCRVSNCYSTDKVHSGNYVGGLVGFRKSSSVNDSFWDNETSGRSSSAGGTGKTTEEMKTKSTFTNAGWDFENTWRMGYAPSGRWTSSWIDLGDVENYLSLETATSIPGNAEVDVKVQVSKNKNKVLDKTNFAKLKDSFNEINLKNLPAARYSRVVYKLVRGSTPAVKNYKLNYTGLLTISLGSCKPGQTVSNSKKLSADAASVGEKKIVEITGYRENNVVIKRTITVTVHG